MSKKRKKKEEEGICYAYGFNRRRKEKKGYMKARGLVEWRKRRWWMGWDGMGRDGMGWDGGAVSLSMCVSLSFS